LIIFIKNKGSLYYKTPNFILLAKTNKIIIFQ
jgi:hypothetical protein